MDPKNLPFDPEAFAQWLIQGLKETLAYRVQNTFSKERLLELARSKVPNRNQLLHQVLKQAFLKDGFQFEEFHQGDATFGLIRKIIRPGPRRLVLLPGFGDTPASWMLSFGFLRRKFMSAFDEILILDFPGYLGFSSQQPLVPSMAVLQSVVKTVCDANPPHTMIGHSLGGWLAAKYAQISGLSGRGVEHLVLIAPSGLTPEEERQGFGDFILEGQKISIEALLARVVYDPKPYQVLLKDEFKAFYSKPELRDFIHSVKTSEFLDPEIPLGAARLSLIWGDADQFVPTQWMRHWIERYGPITDAYLMVQTGHLPQLERPQTLAEVLLCSFSLSKKSGGPNWKRLHTREPDLAKQNVKADLKKLIS
jgi:pimeloyl-ACP methyl ester carboxylesterase